MISTTIVLLLVVLALSVSVTAGLAILAASIMGRD